MVGQKALVSCWGGVAIVESQQFVQQRGAGTPVPKDEDWRIGDRRSGHLPAEQDPLPQPQTGITDAEKRVENREMRAAPMHVETVAGQQADPGGECAADP